MCHLHEASPDSQFCKQNFIHYCFYSLWFYITATLFLYFFFYSVEAHPLIHHPSINFPIQEMFILPQLRSRHATLILAYRVPRCPLGVFCLDAMIRTYWLPSVGFSSFIFGSCRHLLVFEICWYWSSF